MDATLQNIDTCFIVPFPHTSPFSITFIFFHSSDIQNTSIFRRCSKRSIFKYFKKNIIKIQRLENWPLYQVFSSILKKTL